MQVSQHIQLSQRVSRLPGSATLAVNARVKELRAAGEDIIGFGAGEPDFDTPQNIKQAAIDALLAGKTKYAPVPGDPEAREVIARKLREENDIPCSAADSSSASAESTPSISLCNACSMRARIRK
jgi:aspartate aminotransferase